jgi:protocatechuate 3,4-dioxygenase beta subunit
MSPSGGWLRARIMVHNATNARVQPPEDAMADNIYAPRDWSTQPRYIDPSYKSTPLRGPTKPLLPLAQSLSELTGPVFGHESVGPLDADLTKNGRKNGEPLGERIVVTGRVLDEDGRPVPNTLVEIWQCNAAGRYVHVVDQHDAPIDPNFFGGGRCVSNGEGRYRFLTVKPAAYPWGNHHNAWRPAHIHLSLFGPSFLTRLVTQMYFPGDPLLALDPIFKATPEDARDLLVADFSIDVTEPGFALGYVFDIVLRGRRATPREH